MEQCIFCSNIFGNTQMLRQHQKKTKYCLKIQETKAKEDEDAKAKSLEEAKIKEIEENSTLSKKEVQNELNFLKQRIRFTAIDDIPQKYILQAYEIVKDIDVDDTFFVALNRYKHHKIWTLD